MAAKPFAHDELLLLLLQLAALLSVARACGEVLRRFRLPAVVGELAAGVLLGPSVLGLMAPTWQRALFPDDPQQQALLGVVTWLGVMFLLLSTGLETDISLVRRMGRRAPLVSGTGIVVTFTCGFLVGRILPDSLLAPGVDRLVFALFLATSMSISAIPVIARVLMDLGAIRRDVGQLILACGMIDDTVGWILLSMVVGMATSGHFDLWIPLKALGAVVLVLGFAATVGRPAVATLYRWVDDHIHDALSSLTAVLLFVAGAATLTLGLEAILGAFIFGMLLRGAPRYRSEITESLEFTTRQVLAPIFFASAGLRVDLRTFADLSIVPWAALVLFVACAGKLIGVGLGARLAGLRPWEGFAVGSGLNARGAIEIIIAMIGLSLGVLSPAMYAIVVMVALVTSLMAPFLLRLGLRHLPMSADEVERLEREAWARRSLWANLKRVLLLTRGGPNAQVAASLLSRTLSPQPVDVTVLQLRILGSPIDEGATLSAAVALKPLASHRRVVDTSPLRALDVLMQVAERHDLTVLGATEAGEHTGEGFTFSPLVDGFLRQAEGPVLVVRTRGEVHPPMHRILLPTTDTRAGLPAVELGLRLAERTGATATLLHVDEREVDVLAAPWPSPGPPQAHGARVERKVISGDRPADAIVREARDGGYDFIILSAQLRLGPRSAWLGPQVDRLLREAPCPVAVLINR